jgi:hypothetical protein
LGCVQFNFLIRSFQSSGKCTHRRRGDEAAGGGIDALSRSRCRSPPRRRQVLTLAPLLRTSATAT